MTSKDKVIMYLLDDTCVDTCPKCIYDGWWKDENCKGCPEQNKHGDDACRKGMIAWFEQQQQKEKTIGQRIKEKRISLGLKQDELAKKLGVLQITVSKWELDENIPTTLTLMCLADIFDCTTDELLGR